MEVTSDASSVPSSAGTDPSSAPSSAETDPSSAGTDLDEVFRALAEPRRRQILRLVTHFELAAGEIAGTFEVSRTAVSQHLTVLKNAGLLDERRDGTRRLYRARREGLAALRGYLEDMWSESLDVARALVESDAGEERRAG